MRKESGQDGWYVEEVRWLGQTDDVVDDHRWFVAVKVGKLKSLMVDKREDAVFRAKKTIEAGLGHKNLLISCVQRGFASIGSRESPGASGRWAGPVDR